MPSLSWSLRSPKPCRQRHCPSFLLNNHSGSTACGSGIRRATMSSSSRRAAPSSRRISRAASVYFGCGLAATKRERHRSPRWWDLLHPVGGWPSSEPITAVTICGCTVATAVRAFAVASPIFGAGSFSATRSARGRATCNDASTPHVASQGVLEAYLRDPEIDARVDRVEARACEVGFGVGQLDAGGPSILKERAQHPVRFFCRGEPARHAVHGYDRLVQGVSRLGDLELDPVFERLPLRYQARRARFEGAARRRRRSDVVG